MTCLWQHPASRNGDTARLCDKEGRPFCTEHQFIADVLEETESVTSDICEQRETALTAWQAQLRRLRLLVEHADEPTPSAFLKRVHEALPELGRAAMGAVIYTYISSAPKEE
jgi:hypothetical protein